MLTDFLRPPREGRRLVGEGGSEGEGSASALDSPPVLPLRIASACRGLTRGDESLTVWGQGRAYLVSDRPEYSGGGEIEERPSGSV
jgi:hypothetical protein